MKHRTVIIGIDGVPFGLIDALSEKGIMPYFQQLKEEGTFTKMRSSIPEISSVSWSSIITGENPGNHNIYGFTELIDGSYTLSFPHFKKLRVPPFWDQNGTFCIVNVPSTYPAPMLNGVLISGFISPDLEKAVYPREYVHTLKEFNYKIDVDTTKAKYPNVLFKELFEALESRMRVYKYFWNKREWDVFMIVFTGSDRLEHFLWHAYKDETHEYHHKFLEFFQRIDGCIETIDGQLQKGDSLIMVSDHGMEGVECNMNVNCFLEEETFLIRGKNPKVGYNNIKEGTKAFALDPGRVYINKKGKYPLGSVTVEEEEAVLCTLIDAFESLERDGKKVIKKVWLKDDVYHGEYKQYAPDLVLLSEKGVNLKGGILAETVFDGNVLQGKHTYDDAFLYVKSDTPGVIPRNPSVEDVIPVLDQCMGWRR